MDDLLRTIFCDDIIGVINIFLRKFLVIDNIIIDNNHINLKYDYGYYFYTYKIENTRVNKRKIHTFYKNLLKNKRCTLEIYKGTRKIMYIDYYPRTNRYVEKHVEYIITQCDYIDICNQFNKFLKLL